MQYCYVLSLTGSFGMGINCMSYISSLSWACIALEKCHHLFLYQYLVQDAKCFQPMAEEGWKRVRIKCILRAVKWGREGDPGKEGVVMFHSLCLISLQQIGKILSFTFNCFCCLPSLGFFSSTVLKGKKYFSFSYTGATYFDCKNIWWPFDECLPQWIRKLSGLI